MAVTETGAAKAVARVLPQLAGKLSGSATCVPTPNVLLAILNLTLGKDTDRSALNEYAGSKARPWAHADGNSAL